MDLLNRLTIKNLKLNKKRTLVTIIGIMLSVALVTAVATMYSSCIKSLINFETYQKGNFHVAFFEVPLNEVETIKNNRGVDDVYLTKDIGYAKLEESKNEYKPYVYVSATILYEYSNLDILLLKEFLGHSSINATEIYTHISSQKIKEAIEKNPLSEYNAKLVA